MSQLKRHQAIRLSFMKELYQDAHHKLAWRSRTDMAADGLTHFTCVKDHKEHISRMGLFPSGELYAQHHGLLRREQGLGYMAWTDKQRLGEADHPGPFWDIRVNRATAIAFAQAQTLYRTFRAWSDKDGILRTLEMDLRIHPEEYPITNDAGVRVVIDCLHRGGHSHEDIAQFLGLTAAQLLKYRQGGHSERGTFLPLHRSRLIERANLAFHNTLDLEVE